MYLSFTSHHTLLISAWVMGVKQWVVGQCLMGNIMWKVIFSLTAGKSYSSLRSWWFDSCPVAEGMFLVHICTP